MLDDQIMALYWARDPQAIEETDRKYGRLCLRVARNLLSCVEDAEECVSDTYQTAWTHIPSTRPTAFRPWLLKLCRNLSINRFKHDHADKRCTSVCCIKRLM